MSEVIPASEEYFLKGCTTPFFQQYYISNDIVVNVFYLYTTMMQFRVDKSFILTIMKAYIIRAG
jgi:hypothetical protein